jgi:hypothetical protein
LEKVRRKAQGRQALYLAKKPLNAAKAVPMGLGVPVAAKRQDVRDRHPECQHVLWLFPIAPSRTNRFGPWGLRGHRQNPGGQDWFRSRAGSSRKALFWLDSSAFRGPAGLSSRHRVRDWHPVSSPPRVRDRSLAGHRERLRPPTGSSGRGSGQFRESKCSKRGVGLIGSGALPGGWSFFPPDPATVVVTVG